MELLDNTEIKYTIEDELGETYFITLKFQQIEGSMPNFYDQIRQALNLEENDAIKIIKREILE